MSDRLLRRQGGGLLWPWLSALFFLALLIAFGCSYWQESRHERLFNIYFAKEAVVIEENTRVVAATENRPEPLSLIYQQALAYQSTRDYAAALMAWRAYFSEASHPDTSTPYWYAAIAAHQVGAVEEAAYFLDQIPLRLPVARNEQLQWHRALTALRLKDIPLARQLLERIQVGATTIYGKELAPQLLAEIGLG